MTRLLCDSSVWLAAANPGERHHAASRALIEGLANRGEPIGALDLTLYEVANVATTRWRDPELARGLVAFVLDGAADSLVRCGPELLDAATALAAEHGLSVYDGAYAASAAALGWTLVSADMRDLVEPGFAVAPETILV